MTVLRDAAELLSPAVRETIAALQLKPADTAAVTLARHYAREIDDAAVAREEAVAVLAALDDADEEMPDVEARIAALGARVAAEEALRQLGPRLLAVLESLGATPAARSKIRDRDPGDGRPNQLEKFRQAHGRGA